MRLYFSDGKHRLAIDTDRKVYNDNYFYLGGYKDYIKVKYSDIRNILTEMNFNGWDYAEKF